MKPKKARRRDDILNQIIVERIKKLRYNHNFTQEYVIEKTGLDISSLETGRTAPSLVSLSILCKLYNLTLEDFFAGIDYPPKN